MATDNPSLMSHVSIGTAQFERAVEFYDAVLATLGAKRLMEHPGAAAYGKHYPEFWVQTPIDGRPPSVGNGTHVGFLAESKAQVDAFYQAALDAGARPDGAPGPRPHYGAPYYGCFVRDQDGHKIEAAFWDQSAASD
jgi:catechol 2,3-dioxygenase-like lactoylglutathione lyase family enzyme